MDARLIAIGAAGLAGLVAGGTLWALSGGQAQGQALSALDTRLASLPARARGRPDRASEALAQSLAVPLFASSAQASAGESDIAVQLFGVARSPGRTAALLAVGGASAEWLVVGETRSGVTLKAVSGSGAMIATLFGEREVMLGAPMPAAAQGASSNAPGGPPPGFKSPPPPASAPGMSQ